MLSDVKLGDFNHSEAKTYGIKYFSHSTEAVNCAGIRVQGLYFPDTGSEESHREPLLFPIFIYKQNLSQSGYKMFLLALNTCLHSPTTYFIGNYFQKAAISKQAKIF